MNREVFFESQLKNIHDSQKWMWAILAGFSVFTAIKKILEHHKSANVFPSLDEQIGPYLFFLVVLTVVYRFYVADSRILDYYYDSVLKSLNNSQDKQLFLDYLAKLDRSQFFFDATGRVVQYFLIVFVASNIASYRDFTISITLLLIFNAIYSRMICSTFQIKTEGIVDENIRTEMNFGKARKIWIYNNLSFAIILTALLSFQPPFALLQTSTALLLLANSVLDIFLLNNVYLPDYKRMNQTPTDGSS
ncbi:hypothetical protein MIB92_13560 [Aestuariirhabdus sp. Z084]|uniref:hypothetical protein n=1 Tax=Aestuariirhabdus haliotis TaxID=2918751 RepID=UPI0020BE1C15|nr:hypothetical protein [Aestuariirhabdus haliotis]MCL6416682.1 hypothetical protein [Aestuariirhabdus haliotis]